jgi:hypothetical protein
VLAAAGASAAVSTWYVGHQDWQNDPVGFANHLGFSISICPKPSSASWLARTAPLPDGVNGHFGPQLHRFVLTLYH